MSAPPPYNNSYPNSYPQQNYGYGQPMPQYNNGYPQQGGFGYPQPNQPQVVYVERERNRGSDNNCCLYALLACCCALLCCSRDHHGSPDCDCGMDCCGGCFDCDCDC
ncbi:hypothetical protein M3Y98_00814400 [Aphelenchoides besseyi]|nr:hypothetical protein M3Y98_00814400 [Aphelenchoides besseyi]KAI6212159.1 hypothetical protein M3Y96_00510800 [Aphelenchoides besseyi]